MKILVRILLVLAILLGIGYGVTFFLPSHIHVEKRMVMRAQPEVIFPHLNNLEKFASWEPFSKVDPATKKVFSGPDQGVGNRYTWESKHQEVGDGELEIVESEMNNYVKCKMFFGGSKDPSYSAFKMSPATEGTEVIWDMDTDMHGFLKYMNSMMESMIGDSYEKGLENLKAVVEAEQIIFENAAKSDTMSIVQ